MFRAFLQSKPSLGRIRVIAEEFEGSRAPLEVRADTATATIGLKQRPNRCLH
jgi:hypothetical protein